MFGFADCWVAAAYLICILSAVLCVVYGLINWNKDDEMPAPVHPANEDLAIDEV